MKDRKLLFGIVVLTVAVLFQARAQYPFTNGLVAYYPLSGNANDASGNGNNATLAGNYQFVTNEVGQLAFRGIGDGALYYSGGGHVLLPTFNTNLNSGFTFSLWVKDEVPVVANAFSENYISFGALNLPLVEIEFVANLQKVIYVIGPGVGEYAMPVVLQTYINSGWKHLVLAYQPGSFACYFNGQKLYQTNVTVNIFPVAHAAINRHWWDGGASSSARMSATYQKVRIYKRALSDSEVAQLNSYESGPQVGLIKAVKPSFSKLAVGVKYQLQASAELNTWYNQGPPFTATSTDMVYPAYYDVDFWDQLFFRLQVVP